jgi:hypothetical protein
VLCTDGAHTAALTTNWVTSSGVAG